MAACIAIFLCIPFCMQGMSQSTSENDVATSPQTINISSCMRCQTPCIKCQEKKRIAKHNYGPAPDTLVGSCPGCNNYLYLDQNRAKYFMYKNENTLSPVFGSSKSSSSESSQDSQILSESQKNKNLVSEVHGQNAKFFAMISGMTGVLCLSSFLVRTNDATVVAARWGLAGSSFTGALLAGKSFVQSSIHAPEIVRSKRR